MNPQYVTCKNLQINDPEKYRQIVDWLCSNRTQKDIAAQFGISNVTVRAIARTEEAVIANMKKDIRGELMLLSVSALKLYREELEAGTIDAKNIPVQVAIMLDKALLLEGSATSRVEHVTADGDKKLDDFLDTWSSKGVIDIGGQDITVIEEDSNS